MKILCLLPSATEIAYALNLGREVAGVSYACDYPPAARQKRVIVHSKLAHDLSASEIDRAVQEFVGRGESLYHLDGEAVRQIQPDLILTQELCHVCAASPDDLVAIVKALPKPPKLLSLNPHTLDEVWDSIREVGCTTGREREADELAGALQNRILEVQRLVRGRSRPRVACLEWLEPPYIAGHWVPEMVDAAGGLDVLGRAGQPSFASDWKTVSAAQPELVVLMPCGYHLKETITEYAAWTPPQDWAAAPAVRSDHVFAVDADSYFSRPGPRLAEGVEILAGIFYPSSAPAHWTHGKVSRCAPCSMAARP